MNAVSRQSYLPLKHSLLPYKHLVSEAYVFICAAATDKGIKSLRRKHPLSLMMAIGPDGITPAWYISLLPL